MTTQLQPIQANPAATLPDDDRPDIPPRAVFMSPAPIGLGTAQAESIASYFTRMSALNGLTPIQMIWGTALAPLAAANESVGKLRQSGIACFRQRAASTSAAGGEFVRTLAAILGRPELQRLHWGAMFAGFSFARMNRDCDAWCPGCLATDPVPYGRMLWETGQATICPVHRCRLETHCPACGSTPRWAGAANVARCRCSFAKGTAPRLPRDVALAMPPGCPGGPSRRGVGSLGCRSRRRVSQTAGEVPRTGPKHDLSLAAPKAPARADPTRRSEPLQRTADYLTFQRHTRGLFILR